MESTDSKIITSIKKRGRGTVFFADEYAHYSNPKRVQKAMEQLVEKGLVIRVVRGSCISIATVKRYWYLQARVHRKSFETIN